MKSTSMLRLTHLILLVVFSLSSFSVVGQDEKIGGKQKRRNHYFEQGKEAYEEERYGDAIEHLSRSLHYDAYYVDAYFLRALSRESDGDYPGALTDYNIVLHMEPDHMEARFSRGLLYYNDGRFEFAESDFIELMRTPVRETNAIFFRISNYESGVSGAMTMEKKDAEIYNYLGLVRTRMRKYEEALSDFDEAITLNSGEPNYYVNRALVKEEMGLSDLAKTDLEIALIIDPENDLATYNLIRLSSNEESIDLYTDLIEKDPEFAEPYIQRGLAKYNLGDFKGALKDYDQAAEIDTDNADIFLNRGLIKEKLRDLNGAMKDYSLAISLDTTYGKAYFNRANVFSKKLEYLKAIEDYDQAEKYGFNTRGLYYNRGLAFYHLSDIPRACDDVSAALEMGLTTAKKAVNTICKEE